MAVETGPTAPRLSREEIARLEVGHTNVTPATARWLMTVFLVLIAVPGFVDLIANERHTGSASQPWATLAALPEQVRATVAEQSASSDAGLGSRIASRIVAANRTVLGGLRTFEDDLADGSPVFAAFRPSAQSLLSGWLGVGNERVYQGRDGWLFFRPDVDYIVGHGFLDPREMRRRRESAREWRDQPQPDPRGALVEFTQQLEQRGITLIVMPTPVKPTMHPEKLAEGHDWTIPVQNASYRALVEDLRRQRVIVFDVADELAREDARSAAYLATDTHWRPETMERAAELLGAFIRTNVTLDEVPTSRYRVETQEVSHVGDTAAMLDLPADHRLNRPESVTVRRVLDADGTPWQPSRSADVLVLGDSFSNIYSLASLGWGDAAGLVEHLGRVLGRPIDRMVQNDEGAYATRARLRQELASGSDRLLGKRVVILQFAARELATGDWKRIELPPPSDVRPSR